MFMDTFGWCPNKGLKDSSTGKVNSAEVNLKEATWSHHSIVFPNNLGEKKNGIRYYCLLRTKEMSE